MSCLDQPVPNAQVVQGQDLSLNVRLLNGSSDPLDLEAATEVVAIFPITQAPLYIEKKLSLGQVSLVSGAGGRIVITLKPADTMLLTPGAQVSFEVRVTIAAKVSIVQFPQSLNVVASLFPTAP